MCSLPKTNTSVGILSSMSSEERLCFADRANQESDALRQNS